MHIISHRLYNVRICIKKSQSVAQQKYYAANDKLANHGNLAWWCIVRCKSSATTYKLLVSTPCKINYLSALCNYYTEMAELAAHKQSKIPIPQKAEAKCSIRVIMAKVTDAPVIACTTISAPLTKGSGPRHRTMTV